MSNVIDLSRLTQSHATRAATKALRAAMGSPCSSILAAPDANPKLAKNAKQGVLSAPLHLAPFNLSGYQVCPQASAGCAAACLHTAGNPAHMAGKERARINRTQLYFRHRDVFLWSLVQEIQALQAKATKLGKRCAVRLNATSDLPWERVSFTLDHDGPEYTLFTLFPDVQFYDYTKITKRARAVLPTNYHLTFSVAEDNDAAWQEALERGMNVAMVLGIKRGQALPTKIKVNGSERTVIDGDEHDYRPDDIKGGVIVGLRAKGDAVGDTSGFVKYYA